MASKSILVASLPSSGTFFVFDGLLSGFRRLNVQQSPVPGSKQQMHLGEPNQQLLQQRMRECFTIVPFRSFDAMEKSWRRNGWCIETLRRQWPAMRAIKGVFHLSIDAADRDEQLAQLGRELGLKLETDWRPINQSSA